LHFEAASVDAEFGALPDAKRDVILDPLQMRAGDQRAEIG